MKNKHFIFLILMIPVFAFALSGCKGGSSQPSSSTSSTSASPAVAKAASVHSLSLGLWKITMHTTTQMPPMAGRPAINHSYNTVITTCVKPGSKKAKSYMTAPTNKNIKCNKIKGRTGADGAIHWAMQCKGPGMTLVSKGKSKITANGFTSHAIMTETTGASGFSMKTIMDETGRLISGTCPPKS